MTQPRNCRGLCYPLILSVSFLIMGCIWTLSFSSRFLEVPGADLQNVCILQTPEDSSKILELATGRNLVIVGASFIGTRLEGYQVISDSLETPFCGLCRLTRGSWRRDARSPPGWVPPQSSTAGGGLYDTARTHTSLC